MSISEMKINLLKIQLRFLRSIIVSISSVFGSPHDERQK